MYYAALITGVTLGLTFPSLGCVADKYYVSKLGPFGIFIISGYARRLFCCYSVVLLL